MSKVYTIEQIKQIAQAQLEYINAGDKANDEALDKERIDRLEAVQKLEIQHAADITKIEKKIEEAGQQSDTKISQEIENAKSELQGLISDETQAREQALEQMKSDNESAMQQAKDYLDGKVDELNGRIDDLVIPEAATEEDVQPILDLFTVPQE